MTKTTLRHHQPQLARPPRRIIGETVSWCGVCGTALRWSYMAKGWVADNETSRGPENCTEPRHAREEKGK